MRRILIGDVCRGALIAMIFGWVPFFLVFDQAPFKSEEASAIFAFAIYSVIVAGGALIAGIVSARRERHGD